MKHKGWGHYTIEIDLPTFNGERNPKKVRDWLCKLEQFFAVKLTPDWQRTPFASFHLVDYAHTWWRYVKVSTARREREPVSTWAQFTELILDFFMPLEYAESARNCLISLRKSHYKSLRKIFDNRVDKDDHNYRALSNSSTSTSCDDVGELIHCEDFDENDAYFNLLNKVAKDFQSDIWDNIELPSYGGERDPEIFDIWIDRMETYLDAIGVYGIQRIRCASMQLKARAFTIWRYRESTIQQNEREMANSWREFKIHLLEKCLPNYIQQARNELTALKHTKSIKKYNCKFWELSMRVPLLSEEDKVRMYITGLKKEVFSELLYSCPKSLDDAMRLAFLSHCKQSSKTITPKVIMRREMHFKKRDRRSKKHLISNRCPNRLEPLFSIFQDVLTPPDFSYLTNENQMQQYVQRMNKVTHNIECKPHFLKQELRLASIVEDAENNNDFDFE